MVDVFFEQTCGSRSGESNIANWLNSKTFLMKISCSFRLFWDAMLFNSSEKIKSEEELILSWVGFVQLFPKSKRNMYST